MLIVNNIEIVANSSDMGARLLYFILNYCMHIASDTIDSSPEIDSSMFFNPIVGTKDDGYYRKKISKIVKAFMIAEPHITNLEERIFIYNSLDCFAEDDLEMIDYLINNTDDWSFETFLNQYELNEEFNEFKLECHSDDCKNDFIKGIVHLGFLDDLIDKSNDDAWEILNIYQDLKVKHPELVRQFFVQYCPYFNEFKTIFDEDYIEYIKKQIPETEFGFFQMVESFVRIFEKSTYRIAKNEGFREKDYQLLFELFAKSYCGGDLYNRNIVRECDIGDGNSDFVFAINDEPVVLEIKCISGVIELSDERLKRYVKQINEYMDRCQSSLGLILIFDKSGECAENPPLIEKQSGNRDIYLRIVNANVDKKRPSRL